MNFHSPKATAASILARARKGPRPFDLMRAERVLAAETLLNERRWLAGESLRRRHARGWQSDGDDVSALQTDEARTARQMLAETEAKVGPVCWRILVSIVIEGASLRDCRIQALEFPERAVDAVLLDRLRRGLDVAAVEFGLGATEAARP